MPELPEAETIARGLRGRARGRSIREVDVLRPDVVEGPPEAFADSTRGSRIAEVGRRGKNLVLTLVRGPSGGPGTFLVVNLGMSGRLLLDATNTGEILATHPAVHFHLDDGSLLVYHDVRRFGRLTVLTPADYATWSERMGPEPLSDAFDASSFRTALERSRSPVRSWLLDQSKVAGVGNIYANEALWHAGIHPRMPAGDIPPAQADRLHAALGTVLTDAIAAGGTTLRDYRTADGWRGSYAGRLCVYGRESLSCVKCDRLVEREVFGGRSAFLCPRCQPPPGG